MPVSLANLFRLLILLLMAGHGFYMYCLARSLGETVGPRPSAVIGAALFVAVMMIPLAWAVAIPELPELYRWLLGARRWRAGRCATCAYPVHELQSDACPECATPLGEPESYRLSWSTIRRFAVMIAAAWLLGSVAGEAWTSHDEREFAQEVQRQKQAGVDQPYSRPRRWPSENASLLYAPGAGIHATD